MKCKEQEEKLARQKVELKSTKRKALSKGANLAKISWRMHVAKEGVASSNVKIRVTKEHKFDEGHLFQGESTFWRKPSEALSSARSSTKLNSEVTPRHLTTELHSHFWLYKFYLDVLSLRLWMAKNWSYC